MRSIDPSRRGFRLFAVLLAAVSLALAAEAQSDLAEAQRLLGLGRYEDSRKLALEALNANGSDLDAYYVLCSDLLGLGRWADAQNYALKAYAVKRDPRITAILGETAYNLGDNLAALKHLQNFVAAVPEGANVGRAYYLMGEIYLRMARYAHADISLTSALQFVPGNSRWWARLGWAREKANDRSGALAAYRQALVIEPSLEDAALGLARVQASIQG